MTEGSHRDEDELEHRQGRLYPLGRSLRSTFPIHDGEELQPRITSLMVELSHQPYDRPVTPSRPQPAATTSPSTTTSPSAIHQIARFFRRDDQR